MKRRRDSQLVFCVAFGAGCQFRIEAFKSDPGHLRSVYLVGQESYLQELSGSHELVVDSDLESFQLCNQPKSCCECKFDHLYTECHF